MYVYVQKNPNWISYSYGGLFRLGYYILNLSQVESSRIISRWGCAPNSINLPDWTQPHLSSLLFSSP